MVCLLLQHIFYYMASVDLLNFSLFYFVHGSRDGSTLLLARCYDPKYDHLRFLFSSVY